MQEKSFFTERKYAQRGGEPLGWELQGQTV